MELNLDDEYYQKYIKYKQRYMMLKQSKNNNEFEGGNFFGRLFGYGNKTEETNNNNEQNNENDENVQTYLLFHFPQNYLENPEKILPYERIYKRSSATTKKDDINKFLNVDQFFLDYNDAIIITTDGTTSDMRYIDKDSKGINIPFEKFEEYINEEKKKLTIDQDQQNEENKIIEIKYIDDYSEKDLNENDNINVNILNNKIKIFNNKIIELLNLNIDSMKNEFERDPKIINLKKYSTKKLNMVIDESLIIDETQPDNSKKQKNTFFDKFKPNNTNIPLVNNLEPNMIFHIENFNNDDDKFFISEFNIITKNQTYNDIVKKIEEYNASLLIPSTPAA